MIRLLFGIFWFAVCNISTVQAQAEESFDFKGDVYSGIVEENGDTLYLANLDQVTISSPRSFENREDYLMYLRYKRHAAYVYPYALTAIHMFRQLESETDEMSNRERRRYIRKLQRDLRNEFEEPLKGMTRTQGYILTKMIEKELDIPMYFLIKDLRNGLTATYWSTLSSLFGYDLKEGYLPGEDKLLDLVLGDLKIKHTSGNFVELPQSE